MIELLDLDAEVLRSYLAEVTGWIHEQTGGTALRILDVGAGTGTGSLALAARFPDADVTAVDLSEPFLHRLLEKAAAQGVASRVHVVRADLDAGWPAGEPADLVWASMSLHHLADPDRVLGEILGHLAPGGHLAVAEMDGFPTFLPDGGPEARWRAELEADLVHTLPHLGADWGDRLRGAGFAVTAERPWAIEVTHPLPPGTGRYAELTLQRLRGGIESRAGAADLAALDALISGVRHRDDLVVRAARTVWLARRP